MGPVHEKETMANVPCHKKYTAYISMIRILNELYWQSQKATDLKKTKKGNGKNNKNDEEKRFSQTLVEILLNISGLIVSFGKMKRNSDQNIDKKNKKPIQNCIRYCHSFYSVIYL